MRRKDGAEMLLAPAEAGAGGVAMVQEAWLWCKRCGYGKEAWLWRRRRGYGQGVWLWVRRSGLATGSKPVSRILLYIQGDVAMVQGGKEQGITVS